MKNIISNHWPLVTALAILYLVVAIIFLFMKQNIGHFVYRFDDPYIHMAIAKNFVQHGVWGITRYEFSSSSSSVGWTLLLSFVYFIFGVNEFVPFILNIIFATFMVASIYRLSSNYQPIPSFYVFLVLLAVIFLSPLHPLIFAGFEHTLHAFITILFVYFSAKVLSKESFRLLEFNSVCLLVLALFLPLIRYEGLFAIFVVCILFTLRRQWLYSFLLGVVAVIPVGIYGLISVLHGWLLLPNSVVLKGNMPRLWSIKGIIDSLDYLIFQLYKAPHISSLTITGLILYLFRFHKQKEVWENGQIMIVIFVAITFLHALFATVTEWYRYDAYLVATGLFVIVTTLFEYLPKWTQRIEIERKLVPQYVTILIIVLLSFFPLTKRGLSAIVGIPFYARLIYNQNYQLGLFLKQFYQGESVALSDIGAANYLADIKCLDVIGLGTLEVAKKKMNREYNTEELYKLSNSKGVKLAVVYDEWFKKMGGAPPQWVKVQQWKIGPYDNPLSLYVTDISEKDSLIANLKQFALTQKLQLTTEDTKK